MNQVAILYPLFALAAWTFGVLSILPMVRIRAARRGEVHASDFRLGESDAVPESVRLPNRNSVGTRRRACPWHGMSMNDHEPGAGP